jgi:L-glutamine-phosphate cytidylyltransferase
MRIQIMKAIILAAGRGSRMKSLTDDKPKCLTPFRGKPLIEHQLTALNHAGIYDICIVTGYLHEMLINYGSHQVHNFEWENTNMVYSLLCATEWLGSEPFILSYADLAYTTHTIAALNKEKQNITVAYDPDWRTLWEKRFDNPLDDAETFKLDSENFLLDIGKKTNNIDEIQGQYMGLIKFQSDQLSVIKKIFLSVNNPKLDMTTALSVAISNGTRIKAVPKVGFWVEIDSEEDLIACQA